MYRQQRRSAVTEMQKDRPIYRSNYRSGELGNKASRAKRNLRPSASSPFEAGPEAEPQLLSIGPDERKWIDEQFFFSGFTEVNAYIRGGMRQVYLERLRGLLQACGSWNDYTAGKKTGGVTGVLRVRFCLNRAVFSHSRYEGSVGMDYPALFRMMQHYAALYLEKYITTYPESVEFKQLLQKFRETHSLP